MAHTLKGKVVSAKTQKTIVVEVSRLKKHPKYGKFMKVTTRYKAHTEEVVSEGSVVLIMPTRPISKDKRWKLVTVVERAAPIEVLADEVIDK
jgi:small subunit ribosomal protein S17